MLELIPSLIFLIVLQPNANKGNRNLETASPAPDINSRRRRTDGIQRVDSDIHRLDDNVNATVIAAASSGNSSNQRQESTHLLKEVGFAQQGYESTLLYNVTTK